MQLDDSMQVVVGSLRERHVSRQLELSPCACGETFRPMPLKTRAHSCSKCAQGLWTSSGRVFYLQLGDALEVSTML